MRILLSSAEVCLQEEMKNRVTVMWKRLVSRLTQHEWSNAWCNVAAFSCLFNSVQIWKVGSWRLCLQTCFAVFFHEPSFHMPSVSVFPLNDTRGRYLYFNLSLILSLGFSACSHKDLLISAQHVKPSSPKTPTLNKQNTPWGNYYCCWQKNRE